MRRFYEQRLLHDDKSTIAIVEISKAIESINFFHSLVFPDTSFPIEYFLHTPFTHLEQNTNGFEKEILYQKVSAVLQLGLKVNEKEVEHFQ